MSTLFDPQAAPSTKPQLPARHILITGGTGSLGRLLTTTLLDHNPEVERIVVFSRDEHKQYEMALTLSPLHHQRVQFLLGDVRDETRLVQALEGVDTIIHTAAMKQVPAAEENPMECIKTNVLGAENVIQAAIRTGVRRVVALSTDKAAAPNSLYGAAKLCADRLFIAANELYKSRREVRFSVVRFGNLLGSRGSVVYVFQAQQPSGELRITHPDMTRFHIAQPHGVQFILDAMRHMEGGEIYVPRLPSYRVVDLAEAIAPGCRHVFTGIRPGEKLYEDMIPAGDAPYTVAYPHHFVVTPGLPEAQLAAYTARTGGSRVPIDFCYDSRNNDQWLDVEQLRQELALI